jgi:hypothetical protein
MRIGHVIAQRLFGELGQALGYEPARIFTRHLPTDGVWFTASDNGGLGVLPVLALEVVVTEGIKSMRGSIATLIQVSAALGVVLFQDQEVRRGLIRRGRSAEQANQIIISRLNWLREEVHRKPQRLTVWTFDELLTRHRLACNTKIAHAG